MQEARGARSGGGDGEHSRTELEEPPKQKAVGGSEDTMNTAAKTYTPEQLSVLTAALELASSTFRPAPSARDKRLLAKAVLSVADDNSCSVDALATRAILSMMTPMSPHA
jgi:hypothetical protein